MSLGDPGRSGIGLSTLQRAVITQSALRAFERGETSQSLLGAQDAGVAPTSLSYSIGPRAKLDAVQARLDARLEKDPAARRKMAAEA